MDTSNWVSEDFAAFCTVAWYKVAKNEKNTQVKLLKIVFKYST